MAASMRRVSIVWFVALALALSLIGTLAVPVRAVGFAVESTEDASDTTPGDGICASDAGPDEDDCTLRAAIEEANVLAGADAITVPAGTYILSLGSRLFVGEALTIAGAGATSTVIDGNDETWVFELQDAVVGISNLTVTGGFAEDQDGGGILVDQNATLNLTTSVVTDNEASDAGHGGGIFVNEGSTLTLTNSTVSGNTAGADGGGIYIDEDAAADDETVATISGSTISGNAAGSDGGGIFVNDDASVTISLSTISANAAQDDGGGMSVDGTATLSGTTVSTNEAGLGGGIYIDDAGTVNVNAGSTVSDNDAFEGGGIANDGSDTLNMDGSTVRGNTAHNNGGGIWNDEDATAVIVNSTIDNNTAGADPEEGEDRDDLSGDGGGIYNGFCCGGELTLIGSTISNNTADGGSGGGIATDASGGNLTSLLNSTVSGNHADDDGGGIFVDGDLEALFTTVASNSAGVQGEGGGIWTQGSAAFYASLVANNGAAGDCHHNDTGVDTVGSNLDTDDTCEFDHQDDHPDANARIDGLASNPPGGTQTHALQFDSPAVDAVKPGSLHLDAKAEFLLVGLDRVLPTCTVNAPTDQRGIARPQDGDSDGVAVCDIGAYELLPPSASINDVSVVEGDSGTVDLVFTVTLSRPSIGTVTIAYATADGTATVVTDYQAKAGTVTFAPADVSETITVKVVGDLIDEPNEAFVVNLTAPVGATLADAQGTGTILDDEGPIVTLAPTPRQDTLGGTSLPDTGTGVPGLGDWGAGAAIGLVVLSGVVLIRNRRRETLRTR